MACGALKFGTFTLTSGRTSSYYVDIKQASTQPRLLRQIAKDLAAKVQGVDVLAGVELGAVPILVAAALETNLPFAILRKKAKEHGTGQRIEGVAVTGRRVLLIEDVTTTGKSVAEAVRLVREAGATVDRVETVVDRGEGAAEALRDLGVSLGALVSAGDLLVLAKEAPR